MNLTEANRQEIKRQYQFLNEQIVLDREYGDNGYSNRPPFQRDYTRILYSSAFRRLQGKMQILGIQSSAYYRNRLTHSLEVAQIARSIAYNLAVDSDNTIYNNDDLILIEAAALAHDIGHPAFGHKGEHILDSIDKGTNNWIRFEGNAQNFKILRRLEKKEPTIPGLNLTNRCLLAINKYLVRENNGYDQAKAKPITKKFMFTDDFDYLNKIREQVGLNSTRTLDVQIIEIADDIAYAVHDLEDGLALGLFNIDELLFMIKDAESNSTEFKNAYENLNGFVDEAKEYASLSNTYRTLQEYSQVFRKRITTRLTHELVNDITLIQVDEDFANKHGVSIGNWELSLDKYKGMQKCLTKLILQCANRDSIIMEYEAKGEKVVNALYSFYSSDKTNKNGIFLPPDYRPGDNYSLKQGTIDYIAGMMDTYAIKKFEEITGKKFESLSID